MSVIEEIIPDNITMVGGGLTRHLVLIGTIIGIIVVGGIMFASPAM